MVLHLGGICMGGCSSLASQPLPLFVKGLACETRDVLLMGYNNYHIV